jgi:phytoene synthase
MQTNFTHCAALVREADHDRFLATLFAPAEKRDALFALYAFNVEIARIRDVAREPMPGEIRLQWWREALEGKRDSEALAHPVAASLRETLPRHAIEIEPLLALIDAHAFDLYDEPMATLADFDRYAAETQSVLFDVAAGILGVRADNLSSLTRPAGIACAVRNALADTARHAALGDLRRHGLENLAAARAAAEGAPPDRNCAALRGALTAWSRSSRCRVCAGNG